MQVVNLDLMKHPLNWFIIIMMLVIAAIAGHQVLALVNVHPTS